MRRVHLFTQYIVMLTALAPTIDPEGTPDNNEDTLLDPLLANLPLDVSAFEDFVENELATEPDEETYRFVSANELTKPMETQTGIVAEYKQLYRTCFDLDPLTMYGYRLKSRAFEAQLAGHESTLNLEDIEEMLHTFKAILGVAVDKGIESVQRKIRLDEDEISPENYEKCMHVVAEINEILHKQPSLRSNIAEPEEALPIEEPELA